MTCSVVSSTCVPASPGQLQSNGELQFSSQLGDMKHTALTAGLLLLLSRLQQADCLSLLDDLADEAVSGCQSYQSLYWDQINLAARQKLSRMKKMTRRVKRDGYGHKDDTQVVVRCKHGYTGEGRSVEASGGQSDLRLHRWTKNLFDLLLEFRLVLLPGHPSAHGECNDQHHEHD